MIITSELLKQFNVCSEGIFFFERNFPLSLFPNGLDLSKIEIEGDYKDYFYWINELFKSQYEYAKDGKVKKKISFNGWIIEYNQHGDVIKQTLADGSVREWMYEYDEEGNKTTKINGRIYKYNSQGDIVKEISNYGTIREYKYEYDEDGNKTKTIFPNGTIHKYDHDGDLIKIIHPDGYIEEYKYEYDHKRNKIKEIFPNGYIKEYIFKYDYLGRLIQAHNCHIKYLD